MNSNWQTMERVPMRVVIKNSRYVNQIESFPEQCSVSVEMIRSIIILFLFWTLFPIQSVFMQDEEGIVMITDLLVKQLIQQSKMNLTVNYEDLKPEKIPKEYDFIIIGAGSAGSVIANRLSEISEWNILLVEAGQEPIGFSEVPQFAGALLSTNMNWGYLMEKQDGVGLAMEDQRLMAAKGKALGGTSTINSMLSMRGNKMNYNAWEEMGNPGWSYRNVFKYFLKAENALIAINDTGYHSQHGPLNVEDVPYRSEGVKAWVQAAQEAGHKYVDYNGKEQLGVSFMQANLRKGWRCSVEKAYLRPVRHRPNLTILKGARVTKILINSTSKTAYGVEYFKNGKFHVAISKKEVICSAGAYHTAQLLMLSGIGPQDHLQDMGIPLIKDSPVGKKMYDHLTFVGLMFTTNVTINPSYEFFFNLNSMVEWVRGEGLMTCPGGVEGITYIKTGEIGKKPNGRTDVPNVELVYVQGTIGTEPGLVYRKMFNIRQDVYDDFYKPLRHVPSFAILPAVIQPKSYGYLKLRSKSPFDSPRIYGNYFTDPDNEDMRAMIQGIREAQRIMTHPAMQRYGVRLHQIPVPGCHEPTTQFDSDEYWECAVRHLSTSFYHETATCKMGRRDDPEAVVDHELRVHGVNKLRVADAGVIPLSITAHTNVPAVMIGEKASDLIKESWLQQGK